MNAYDEKVWCRRGNDHKGHWAMKSDMTWLSLPRGGRIRMCMECKNAEIDRREVVRSKQ